MPPRVRKSSTSTAPPPSRRPTAIVSLQDQEAPRYRKWCVYGESDAGKTVLAGTAPNALFLSTDVEGTESARMLGSQAKELRITTFADFCDAVDWLVRGQGYKEFEWIIPDTITELEEMCWEDQMVSDSLARASQYQPNKGDFPMVWKRTKEQLMLLGRAPVNVLFVAHTMRIDRETEDGDDTETLAMPALGSRKRGDLSMQLCAQLGMVGYMRKVTEEGGKIQRQLLTASSNRWVARDRSTKLGNGLSEPTIPKLLAKINGEAATATRATRRRRAS